MDRLFKKIDVNQKRKLLHLLETSALFYKKDNVILSTIKDNIIGIVLEGNAQIIRTDYNGNRTIIEELKEEDIFGSFLSSLKSDECEIVTKEDTKVLIIDYDRIIEDDYNKPYYNQFVKNLLEITTNIIDEKNDRIEILTKKTIRDKLLEYFNIYARRRGTHIIYLPFSLTDFSDYLAVDRSAMSRELKNLKDEGFITQEGRKIVLKYRTR